MKARVERGLLLHSGLAFALAFVPLTVTAASKPTQPRSLVGFKAVAVRYNFNTMIADVRLNGRRAAMIVDTGARTTMLDMNAAELCGVSSSGHGRRYSALRSIGSTPVNGQLYPVGLVKSFAIGDINFGSTFVALRQSMNGQSFSTGPVHVDGLLGRDLLMRKNVIINCGTKLMFFAAEGATPPQLERFAASQHFAKVPMQREENGALTVAYSINGRLGKLVVDTGALITTLNESAVKSAGVKLEPTRAKTRFMTGAVEQISLAQVDHLKIGEFKVPPMKLGAAALPNFAVEQGRSRVDGMLGLELLVICHAIIDPAGKSLYLR